MAITKWEYAKEHSEGSLTSAILNTFGKNGWQLCDKEQVGMGYYYTFKRPIMDSVLSSISQERDERLLMAFGKHLGFGTGPELPLDALEQGIKSFSHQL